METPEYTPFDMNCARCEHLPVCNICLKLANKVTYKWFGYLKRMHVTSRDHLCRQGRKRKVIKQSTIAECVERCDKRNHPEVTG
jgi:hypothetical protein